MKVKIISSRVEVAEVSIPLWPFEQDIDTLQPIKEGATEKIWVMYQDQCTLVLVSDYYLSRFGYSFTNPKATIRLKKMFSADATLSMGSLKFEFNTACGVSEKELRRAVCYIEDSFVKIGLRGV